MTLNLSDELAGQLKQIAEHRGVSIEQLLRDWVEDVRLKTPMPLDESAKKYLVATHQLLHWPPSYGADLSDLIDVIQSTEPRYPTLEDAMTALRGREWKLDD